MDRSEASRSGLLIGFIMGLRLRGQLRLHFQSLTTITPLSDGRHFLSSSTCGPALASLGCTVSFCPMRVVLRMLLVLPHQNPSDSSSCSSNKISPGLQSDFLDLSGLSMHFKVRLHMTLKRQASAMAMPKRRLLCFCWLIPAWTPKLLCRAALHRPGVPCNHGPLEGQSLRSLSRQSLFFLYIGFDDPLHVLQEGENVIKINALTGGNSAKPVLKGVVHTLMQHDATAQRIGANARELVWKVLQPDRL